MDGTIAEICATIARTAPSVRAALPGRRIEDGGENPSGETQLAADVYADGLFETNVGAIDGVGTYASEERATPIDVGSGRLSVAIDPLDGSSNLRSNNTMGTIFGVYDGRLPASGRELLAAGYVLYGPITTMVVAHDGTVTESVVADGDRRVVDDDLELPTQPTVYGFGGRAPDWPPAFEAYVREIESELKLRYGGSMVGDVNQVVTYGGVFAYPALESAPEGKLRLQFEANPMAYVVETAGGRSSDGTGSILDVAPEELHQRIPVHVGTESLIDRLESALA
ncbi:MAG: class 1 fructose-bisphosphatase [Halobacteriota archaeon]